jgi:cystathionine beta-lyase
MDYRIDACIERRGTDSAKWCRYDDDVIPLWVADMDFPSPEPVVRALRERVEHGVFGYGVEPPELRGVITDRLLRLYGWSVDPASLIFIPGVVTGFNLACHIIGIPNAGVSMQTPIYHPMLQAPANSGLKLHDTQLVRRSDGRYEFDFDTLESAITPQTRLLMLCNPHNPVGRVYRRDELERLADICLKHDLLICSDEIHCDILFTGANHIPIASLAPEIGARTITLIAPSKTFNIPGLRCSVAIIQDAGLRERFEAARRGIVSGVNIMGFLAALAAYRDGQSWLTEVLRKIEGNRDFLMEYVSSHLTGVKMAKPEGTFLAWLDCNGAGIPSNPSEFFLREAKVAMNDGCSFGRGGDGFVRLNFACSRAVLEEGLGRIKDTLMRL